MIVRMQQKSASAKGPSAKSGAKSFSNVAYAAGTAAPSTECTGVQSAAKADPLFQIAQEVEKLSKGKAFALVDELIAEGGNNDFKLGGVLAVIHDECAAEGNEEWLEGQKNFTEVCENRFKFGYRKALYLIDIYKHLVEEQIEWEQVKDLRWPKLRELAAKKVITKKNAASWVAKGVTLTHQQLCNVLRGGDTPSKTTTVTFKVHEDQKEAIREALDKAKKQTGTEVDTVALHNICQGYLGNAVQIETVGEVEEKPKQKGKLKEYWVERFKQQFKEAEHDLGKGDEGGPGLILEVFADEYPEVEVEAEFPA